MLFSSLVFIYIFLPTTLILYYLIPNVFKNTLLFIASLMFFAWGGVSYSSVLIISILFNYLFGKLIGNTDRKKLWLSIGVTINLLFLIVFKYLNFIIDNINSVISWFSVPTIDNPSILLPIGISFYTFQSISYLIDVYRTTCSVQNKIVNLGLYISFFPQLIAGPIVRYFDIQKQIDKRHHSIEKFSSGIKRFTLGFGKKVIIANNLAFVADEIFSLQPDSFNSPLAWIAILAYSLQIYYDFAGYSDMAIGLARMFGFDLLENFNFPYISKSIREFWRRWHISLSNWFRDYLYIPLGGNQKGSRRTLINLFIVFFITGFWHGASWSFLLWGLFHGFCIVIERTQFGTIFNKLPSLIKQTYTLLIVILAWVLFRSENLSYAIDFYEILFGLKTGVSNPFLISKIITREFLIVFIIAIMGALGLFQIIYKSIRKQTSTLSGQLQVKLGLINQLVFVVFMLFVMLYGTGLLVIGSYNPFIYFRF